MKFTTISKASLPLILLGSLALPFGCTENDKVGHSETISRNETNKKGWFGGQTHEVNTVYRNPDGSTSVETETRTTRGDTTTVTREKKTTNLDGTVKTERESHKIVNGQDSYESSMKKD